MRGVKAGTATITATARDGSGKSASVQVRVGPLDNTIVNVLLPLTGTGYKSYPPGLTTYKYGTQRTIHILQDIGRQWDAKGWGLIGIGCISANGGGCCGEHGGNSHDYGKSIDIRPARTDGTGDALNISLNPSAYSRERTRELIKMILAAGDVRHILFNDPVLISEFDKVRYWENHDDHLHVSFN